MVRATTNPLISALTISAVGLSCKAFLNFGLCASVRTRGVNYLIDALEKNDGRGVLTVSNHISTLDEPLTWGILPSSYYLSPLLPKNKMRWTLGASDIMFTSPLLSSFFRLGQVIETFRGKGVYQPAVDDSIQLLHEGKWLHVYPEGYVKKKDASYMRRFKWGIGRILMEVDPVPRIIPIFVTGFDKLILEEQPSPWKYLPRTGQELTITIGDPARVEKRVAEHLARWHSTSHKNHADVEATRVLITQVIQEEVEKMGLEIEGGLAH